MYVHEKTRKKRVVAIKSVIHLKYSFVRNHMHSVLYIQIRNILLYICFLLEDDLLILR